MPQWHSIAGEAGLQAGMEIAKACNLSQNPPFFETMPYVQTALQSVGVDWLARQAYNVRHGALRVLVMGRGQNSLKTRQYVLIRAK
jgi:hypothetical protein